MEKAVFGIAKTEDQAVNIANQLKAAGFSESDISVLFPDKTGTRDFAHEQHTKAPEGAAAGAGTGAVLGGALGWMVGIGALAIPGLGPFIAAGPVMAALAGLGAGAAAGVKPDTSGVCAAPAGVASRLPLFRRFPARLVADLLPQQDQYEPSSVALCVVALAREIARTR